MKKGKTDLLQLFVSLFLFASVLAGLAFYGVAVAIVGATLVLCSTHFHSWLIVQRGYARRLSKLPGLGSTSPILLAVAILAYLLPLSVVCWMLMGEAIGGFSNVGRTLVAAIGGLIGIDILYKRLIHGRGLESAASHVTAGAKFSGERYLQRIKQLDQIRAMDPIAFEQFVGSLFKKMGYTVQTTVASGDEGVDLHLRKGGRTAVVQCKRYEGTVGQPVVRDLCGAMVHNRADEAHLVTTGTISLPAQQWATGKPIHLIDGNALVEWIDASTSTGFFFGAAVNFLRRTTIAFGVWSAVFILSILWYQIGLSIYRPEATPRSHQPTMTSIPSSTQCSEPKKLGTF